MKNGGKSLKFISYEKNSSRFAGLMLNRKSFISFQKLSEVTGLELPHRVEEVMKQSFLETFKKVFTDKSLYRECLKFSEEVSNVHILPPILSPPKLIFLGLNYVDHAQEQGLTPPDEPVIFFKPQTSLTGPFDEIIWPKITKKLDYEGELAVVIGLEGKYIEESEAMNHVLGYTICNDVSARDIQFKDRQWTRGKSYDTFSPMGPWIVTKDEIRNPHNLKIITKVNGEVRQNSNTNKMALKIQKIISVLSQGMTLKPGDVIATGTPAGVGFAFKPKPKFLREGDVVEIEIEKIGKIRNKVVKE